VKVSPEKAFGPLQLHLWRLRILLVRRGLRFGEPIALGFQPVVFLLNLPQPP
jgi:hypothetical protein